MSQTVKQAQETHNELIGKKIGHKRSMAGMQQDELANELGVSLSLVQRTEAGQRTIGAAELRSIAKILKTTVNDLM